MKRRTTKRLLRESELFLTKSLRPYFERPTGTYRERSSIYEEPVVLALLFVLRLHLEVGPISPQRKWIKKFDFSEVSVNNPRLISWRGEIQWSELDEKPLTTEPLELIVRLIKTNKPVMEYEVKFGRESSRAAIKRVVKRAA